MLALAQAEAERDAAVTALDKRGRRVRRRARERRIVVVVLVVLFSVLLPITFVVTWAHYTALNTNGFVNTLGPVATDPAVTAAVSAEVTDQVYNALNPEQILKSALPPRVQFLAGPISNGAKTYVQSGVNTVLQSSQFQTLWTQALRFAHSQLVSALNGNSGAVKTTNGQVVLDLVPLFNNVLQNLQPYITGVVGHSVTLPTITANEVPATACKQISQALNRPLPATCGQIVLFPADKLNEARRLVRIFNGITILLLILTPVVAALALWVSRRRRRTLLQLCVGGVIGLVVIRRVVHWLGTTLVNTGNPANKAARQAIVTHLFHIYYDVSTWILIALVIVFAIALVTGPYAWAVSFRRVAGHWLRAGWNLVVALAGHARDDATVEWVRSHLDLLRVLGVVVALVLLLALSVSWIGFLIIAVLLVGYEYWLYRIGQAARTGDPSLPPPDDAAPPPDQPTSPTGDPGVVQPR